MNIKDIFRKAFKSSGLTHDIITYNSLVNIPDRDFFKEDQNMLNLIDSYKLQYIQNLATKKYMLSSDFSDDGLLEEVAVNTDMLVYLVMKHSDKQEMWNADTELAANEKTERIIFYYKLELYMGKLNQLEMDTIMKLIALNEVRREKPFLSPVKRRAIGNFHNLLMRDVYLLISQRDAIKKEINNNFAMLNKAILDRNPTIDDNDFLTKRLDVLIARGHEIMPLKMEEILDGNERLELKIARIEREFEIYVYKNKDNFKVFTQKLDDIDKNIHTYEYETLLELIQIIENEYKFFHEFGRNIVTDEDFYYLYQVKFKIKTLNILNEGKWKFIKGDEREFECYKDIIMKKIELIVRGENSNINSYFERSTSAIRSIINILKDRKEQLDFEEILTNYYLLAFLLSFDTADGFKKFIDKFYFKVEWPSAVHKYDGGMFIECFDSYCDENFVNKELPISTILWLWDICLHSKKTCQGEYDYFVTFCKPKFDDFYNLEYKCRKKKDIFSDVIEMHLYAELPEGIKKLNYNPETYYYPLFRAVINKIREELKLSNYLIFPNSILEVSGNFLEGTTLTNMYFREGITKVVDFPFGASINTMQLLDICIPSTVECFNISRNFSNLCFNNFKNSKLLHSRKLLNDFFKNKIILTNRMVIEDKIVDHIEFQNFKVRQLTLEDNGNKTSIILDEVLYRCGSDFSLKDNLDKFIDVFVDVIQEETGYRIEFRDENTNIDKKLLGSQNKEKEKTKKLTR